MKKLFSFLAFSMTLLLFAQKDFVEQNYAKKEVYITMRDGVKLFTQIYTPKDISKKNKYPILMNRTPYSIAPYGLDQFKRGLGPDPFTEKEKYIFVYQDVRGRYMSYGQYTNMTPQVEHKTKKDVDESTDTFDTIDWLVKHVKNNNGKVGQYGISYPGFYTTAGAISGHPALKASSPQAPISDFWFDDFHHNGDFVMGYFRTFPVFGVQKTEPTDKAWFSEQMKRVAPTSPDGSIFYNTLGTMKDAVAKYYPDNFFMQNTVHHPNYDQFWQSRNILPHLKNIKHPVMVVGGWFDAEDLAGALKTYKTIHANDPKSKSSIVMGPWFHGQWAREQGKSYHNDIYFGDSISTFYQKTMEAPFFHHYLKDDKTPLNLPTAYMFDTGKKEWSQFAEWPPKKAVTTDFYLTSTGKLSTSPETQKGFVQYYSDPNEPVPSSMNLKDFNGFTPRNYMSEDQRFAAHRPDVVTFTTDYLTDDITLAGEILAKLKVASTSTDADFFVKLVDIYPPNAPQDPNKPDVLFANYHQMVRSEIMPARFRNSFEKPEALVPNQEADVTFHLQDVYHTFKKGHKIQIQIQSTAYPLFMINPQKFVPNPYEATKSDYTPAFEKIFNNSVIQVQVLK